MSILIGNVKVERAAALAPMAGISDSVFRQICKEFGAALTVSEMVSAKALCYNDSKTKSLLNFKEVERPFAVQIFGSEPECMAKAAHKIEKEVAPDIIDINMGCPAPKIIKSFSGSSLMRDEALAKRIIDSVCKSVSIPVTVKIRKGWDETSVNAVRFAKNAQEAGAAAIIIHGRTRADMFSKDVDLKIIKELKDSLNIPVIGNGSVDTFSSAQEMCSKTGCDLVMVGRGALGRPWVFSQIKLGLEGLGYAKPNATGLAQLMLRHGKMLCENFGELHGMKQMRKHVIWYTKSMKNSASLRRDAASLRYIFELEDLAKRISKS